MKTIIKLIISLSIISLIMPIYVHADGSMYLSLPYNVDVSAYRFQNSVNDFWVKYKNITSGVDVRLVMLKDGNYWQPWLVADASSSVVVTSNNTTSYVLSSESQGYRYKMIDRSEYIDFVKSPVVPLIDQPSNITNAIYYSFGEGNGDAPAITYGTLKDLSYSTSIVGSGNGTGSSNIDTISWYPFADSNNKMFGTDGTVELRVVPGDYVSGTQEGLLTQTYSDFVLDYAHAGHLATVNAYQGSYKVSWGVVMNKLSMTWPALQLIWDGDYWKKVGWVYQARYHMEDLGEDSWSEWQTVYTITSSTPTGTNGLDPSDGTAMPGFYQDVKDSYNTTSIVNNNTNVTYYINNVPTTVNVTPENENPSSGDSFWDWIGSLISALLDLVGTVGGWIKDLITAVIGLAGDIIDGILGLFQLPDFTINNYNTEVQNIKNNSGIFGQAVDFTTDVKTQLDLISTTPQDLSFTFPGITLMNVVVIPEVNASYTQIVSDLGLTEFHNMVYMFTDGFVIISLIVLVYRKLMGVLRK